MSSTAISTFNGSIDTVLSSYIASKTIADCLVEGSTSDAGWSKLDGRTTEYAYLHDQCDNTGGLKDARDTLVDLCNPNPFIAAIEKEVKREKYARLNFKAPLKQTVDGLKAGHQMLCEELHGKMLMEEPKTDPETAKKWLQQNIVPHQKLQLEFFAACESLWKMEHVCGHTLGLAPTLLRAMMKKCEGNRGKEEYSTGWLATLKEFSAKGLEGFDIPVVTKACPTCARAGK